VLLYCLINFLKNSGVRFEVSILLSISRDDVSVVVYLLTTLKLLGKVLGLPIVDTIEAKTW
jgi:hypothetical protein